MKHAKTQLLSNFYLSGGEWDPDECTRQLGLAPNFTRRKGSASKGTPRVSALHPYWGISTEWCELRSVNDSLAPLLEQVWPLRDRIRNFCDQSGAHAGFETAIEIRDERPVYDVSRESIIKMSELRAEFGLDIYDRREKE